MADEQEQAQPQGYTLTAGEKAVVQSLAGRIGAGKVKLHDLREAEIKARAELEAAQQAFSGAVTLLANTHGIGQGRITGDLARIVAAGMPGMEA